jgi:hypothetical protein
VGVGIIVGDGVAVGPPGVFVGVGTPAGVFVGVGTPAGVFVGVGVWPELGMTKQVSGVPTP